ncbi:MAG: UDP-N-acetylmuramate dehydrogenase [Acidimicrobiales bacterium]
MTGSGVSGSGVSGSGGVAVAAEVLGRRARREEPLGPRTTFRVGGRAALCVEVVGESDLTEAASAVAASGVAVLVVGRGSNLLVSDRGFGGLAVGLGEGFAAIEVDGGLVRAGGSVALPVLARRTAACGLGGMEWAVGVPGSIGGAVRMNAGGHGSDMAATLLRARLVDLRWGRDEVVAAEDLELGYRRSAVTPSQVVVWAELGLPAGDTGAASRKMGEIVRWRREHQPGGQNAGSVFTNPPGDAAGGLVERAGCKGLRRGSAAVSTKHANFIQVDPDGSADDVRWVMGVVQARVQEVTGVWLEPEVQLIGFDKETLS